MSKVNDDNFINIQGWMVSKLKLKGNELLIYAIIYGFTQDGESKFTGSLQYLADWTNSTKQGVMKVLKSLYEKGLIFKEERLVNGVKFCQYFVIREAIDRAYNNEPELNGMQQSLPGYETKFNGGGKQSLTGGMKQSLPNTIEEEKENLYNKSNNKEGRRSKDVVTEDNAYALMDETNISEPLREQVIEWLAYKKEQFNDTYKERGFRSLLKQVEKAEQEHGTKAVIDQIETAQASTWHGMFLDKIISNGKSATAKKDSFTGGLDLLMSEGWFND